MDRTTATPPDPTGLDHTGLDHTGLDHTGLVDRQFGERAAAYIASAVHAAGEDLHALAALAAETPDARVLDLGCGGGHVAYAVAPVVQQVVAYDLSPAMLDAVAAEAGRRGLANITVRQGCASQLPFADAGFDLVISRFSAHHWPDLSAGLTEAARVLRPGGRAVFVDVIAPPSAPLDSFLQTIEMLRDPSHGRNYSMAEWRRALEAAGLPCMSARTARLRMAFADWIARMQTPAPSADAIRALQTGASAEVRRHFGLEADGSFTLDTGFFQGLRAGSV